MEADRARQGRWWRPDFPFAPRRVPLFYGWVVVVVATLGIVFSIPGQTMGFSVFTDVLMGELGLSRVALSTAYCVGTVLSGLSLPALGRLFDRWGARRMAVGAACATGLILLALSQVGRFSRALASLLVFLPPAWVAFATIVVGFYLIRAAAQGVLTMTCRNAIGKWFDYHRGTALAWSGVVTSFSFSVAPRCLDALTARFGWDGAWALLGAVTIVVMGGLAWVFLRDNPEECGLRMDGDSSRGAGRRRHADAITRRDYLPSEAFRTGAFWAFNLAFAFYALFGTAFTFHIVSIAAESGRARTEMLSYFVPMSVVSVATNLLFGWLSPRVRLKYLLAVMNLGALAGVCGLLAIASPGGVLFHILGNGIAGGSFMALSGIVWPRFYGRRWLGGISGANMSTMVIASGVGPLVFSLSLALTGSYRAVLIACLAVPLLLLAASFRADNPQRSLPAA